MLSSGILPLPAARALLRDLVSPELHSVVFATRSDEMKVCDSADTATALPFSISFLLLADIFIPDRHLQGTGSLN
jgi:hypothetical protein